MEKTCPRCGLTSPFSVLRCPCGFALEPEFLTGVEQFVQERPRPSSFLNWVGRFTILGAAIALFIALVTRVSETLDAVCATPLAGAAVGTLCGTAGWLWTRARKTRDDFHAIDESGPGFAPASRSQDGSAESFRTSAPHRPGDAAGQKRR